MRNRTRRQSLLFALVVTLIVSTGLPGAAQPEVAVQPYLGFQGEDGGTPDLDNRVGMVAPTSGQEALARRLGGSVRWNEFGTPHVLMNHRGVLSGPRDGDHVEIARGWVRDHRELFRLTTAGVDALQVLRVSPLFDSPDQVRDARGQALANPDVATVVLFRQTFGELSAAQDGLLHVGVTAEGAVA